MSPNSQVFTNMHLQSGAAMGRDRISNLPNDIISHILSRLPTREAIQSSIWSKDWKRNWHGVSNFEIDDRWFLNNAEGGSFLVYLERTFPYLQNVRRLTLHSQGTYDVIRLGTCLHAFLVGKGIQYFSYENLNQEGCIFLPAVLINCTSLRHLILGSRFAFPVPTQNHLTNLRRLNLSRVLFGLLQNGSTDKVSFTLPVVENIYLGECVWLNIKFVEIYAPRLIDFEAYTVEEHVNPVADHTIRIHGAKIQRFCVSGGFPESIELPASTVVSVAFDNDPGMNPNTEMPEYGSKTRKLLENLSGSGMKELKQCGFLAEATAIAKDGLPLPKFRALEKIVVDSYVKVKGLLLLLHASPCLKFLKLEPDAKCTWDDFSYDVDVPSCVVSHLEGVEFQYFLCSEPEYGLVKLIVENGAMMKRFAVKCYEETEEDRGKRDEEVMARLSTFSRASSCLEFEIM